MTYKNTRRGFTLIELLVVVLIIGILAAVAVPQYKVAVVRSRLAAVKPFLSAIKEAEETYYLTNGNYAGNLSKLDLSFTSAANTSSTFAINEYFRANLLGDGTGRNYIGVFYCPGYVHDNTQCLNKRDFSLLIWFKNSNKPGQITCEAYSSLGQNICKKENIN